MPQHSSPQYWSLSCFYSSKISLSLFADLVGIVTTFLYCLTALSMKTWKFAFEWPLIKPLRYEFLRGCYHEAVTEIGNCNGTQWHICVWINPYTNIQTLSLIFNYKTLRTITWQNTPLLYGEDVSSLMCSNQDHRVLRIFQYQSLFSGPIQSDIMEVWSTIPQLRIIHVLLFPILVAWWVISNLMMLLPT